MIIKKLTYENAKILNISQQQKGGRRRLGRALVAG